MMVETRDEYEAWRPRGPQTQPPADIGEMVERLRRFVQMWSEKPLKGIDDEFYGIHTGTEWEASLRASDLRALLTDWDDLVRKLERATGAMVYAAETTNDKHTSRKLFAARAALNMVREQKPTQGVR